MEAQYIVKDKGKAAHPTILKSSFHSSLALCHLKMEAQTDIQAIPAYRAREGG